MHFNSPVNVNLGVITLVKLARVPEVGDIGQNKTSFLLGGNLKTENTKLDVYLEHLVKFSRNFVHYWAEIINMLKTFL